MAEENSQKIAQLLCRDNDVDEHIQNLPSYYEGLDGVNWQLTNGQNFNWQLTNRLKFNWQLTFVEVFTDNWQKILLP